MRARKTTKLINNSFTWKMNSAAQFDLIIFFVTLYQSETSHSDSRLLLSWMQFSVFYVLWPIYFVVKSASKIIACKMLIDCSFYLHWIPSSHSLTERLSEKANSQKMEKNGKNVDRKNPIHFKCYIILHTSVILWVWALVLNHFYRKFCMQFSFAFAFIWTSTQTHGNVKLSIKYTGTTRSYNNIEQGKSACFASCHNFLLLLFKFINMEKVSPLCCRIHLHTTSNTRPTSR